MNDLGLCVHVLSLLLNRNVVLLWNNLLMPLYNIETNQHEIASKESKRPNEAR
jgi:hypothetical protein